MWKAWLLVFVWDPSNNFEFIQKWEAPYRTLHECRLALKDERVGIFPGYHTQKFCVTDDHREGKRLDPGVPLEPTPFR